MAPKDLYYIALLLPAPLADTVRSFQEDFASRYGSVHALRSPPHMTLVSPFAALPGEGVAPATRLCAAAAGLPACTVDLDGFGRFGHRVLFIRVRTNPALASLQAGLSASFPRPGPAKGLPHRERFTPHITLAHRDLAPDAFREAWADYGERPFRERFVAKSVSLLHLEAGGWVECRRCDLAPPAGD